MATTDVDIPPDMDMPPDGKESDQPSNTEDDLVDETSIDMTRNNVMKWPTRQSTLKARKKISEWLNPSENFICVGSVATPIGSRVLISRGKKIVV